LRVFGKPHQHADSPHLTRLLGPSGKRRGEERGRSSKERAALHHSIT
jgi:hypothetical protein